MKQKRRTKRNSISSSSINVEENHSVFNLIFLNVFIKEVEEEAEEADIKREKRMK